MERILESAAARWGALRARIGCPDCGRHLALAAELAGLTGILAVVAGDVVDTEAVQIVAQLLVRGLPF